MAKLYAKAPDGSDALLSIVITGFTQSLQQNGWCKLPNSLIFQWGRCGNSNQRPYVRYTITFNTIYSIAINNGGNNTTRIQGDCNAYNINTSGFTVYIVGDSSRYIVIGI